eukprot:352342-Chlamydomonas_euryale.AAC.6
MGSAAPAAAATDPGTWGRLRRQPRDRPRHMGSAASAGRVFFKDEFGQHQQAYCLLRPRQRDSRRPAALGADRAQHSPATSASHLAGGLAVAGDATGTNRSGQRRHTHAQVNRASLARSPQLPALFLPTRACRCTH